MAKTISTRLSQAVAYTSSADNPLTITSTGGILAATGGYALSLGGSGIVWSVDQEGTVSAAGNIGVTIAEGSLVNTTGALVEGATFGVVLGGPGSVVNAGTIVGGTDAVSVADGATVIADPGAVFSGTVHGGGAASVLQFASGSAQGTLSGLGAQYAGFGSYTVAANARWLASGTNTLAMPGTFVNDGHLSANAEILVQSGTVLNTGTVYSTHSLAFDITNAQVSNAASAVISGIAAARLHNGVTMVNAGTLSGSVDGLYDVASGTIINQSGGLLTGVYDGAALGYFAVMINGGSISATYPSGAFYGVDAENSATLVNQTTGVITGYNGVQVGRTKGALVPAATMLNQGLVVGHSHGAYINGGTISNASGGTITGGPSGTGVFMHSGTLDNAAHGIIEGGTTGVSGYGLIINAGTIMGSASGYALQLVKGSASRLVIESGGTFIGTVNGGGSLGTLELPGQVGTLTGIGSSLIGFGHITLDAGSNWLVEGSAGGFNGDAISGLAQAGTVELQGTVASEVAFANYSLTLSGGLTLGLYGMTGVSVTNDGANTFITACFASGTRIATARGAVAVEALRVGDRVATVTGRLASVRWIGHRQTDLRRHSSPHDVMPVRVRAGAFADKVPERDLILSPDHAVLVEGRLVPIRHLANGESIVQESRESVTYWHVELDRHDAILAEGLACESYLDTGNRCAFAGEPAVALHPDFGRDRALAVWQAQGCAEILTDPADPELRALHLRLLAWWARRPRLPDARRSA
ncbi:MAG: Hint domain-containing protein [Rhodospirillales bacterium]|nr:Hint domain-containing protein [Rhodospirillales bacterium]